MNKQQALALITALEARKMPCSATLAFDAGGNETWSVSLQPATTYFGADIGALATYCAQNGLTLSLIVESMGVT